ncbi:MAG: sugar phosphate isomerase/epimerase [Gemmatimonadetes bacterium]|jgi:sugar phosphate isomerase/epimerase|nr:sugar phosphate isomerase/epimerase [Gemmatimonadota bacterium]
MKLGIFSKTFLRPTLEESFAAIAAHGLESIQFNWESAGLDEMPDAVSDSLCTTVRQGLKKHGLELAAVSGTFNMIHPVHRAEGMRRLRSLARACPSLGTRLITLCTGTRDLENQWRYHPDNQTPEAWRDMLDAMREAVAIAEAHDVVLVFEPEVNNIVDSAQKARKLLDEIPSNHLKVVIDGANLFHRGELSRMHEILDEAFQLLGDDILLAHGKDLERDGDAGHQAAGTGVLDYAHYLHCLDRIGFEGTIALHSLSQEQAPASIAYLRERWPR